MTMLLRVTLSGVTPIAFASVEAMLLVAAALAAAGAVLTAVILARSRHRRPTPDDEPVRRSPSPSSLGMPDDPIVAALVGAEDDRRSRRARRADPVEPRT